MITAQNIQNSQRLLNEGNTLCLHKYQELKRSDLNLHQSKHIIHVLPHIFIPSSLFSSYHPSSSLSFLLRMTHNLSPSHHVGVSSFLVSFSSHFLSFSLSFGNQSDLIDGLCSNLGQRINRRKDYPYSATLMLSHMTTTRAKQINKQTMHADRSKSPCLYLTRSPASLRAKT